MESLRPSDPRTIGGFRLLARLGAGGMGEVYLGLADDGRHVAVKVIRSDFDGAEALARFRHEVENVGILRSPYAAALVAAELTTAPYWLATEYVQGPTLSAAVAAHGALAAGPARWLAAGLAAAVADVHRQGMVHRDLKPHNVILSTSGPRLIDFGIARTAIQTALTQTGGAIGTPGYLAPEIVQGGAATAASDIFSLGSLLAFAATGRPPFGSGDPHAVMFRSVQNPVDVDGVEEELARLIAWCASKDPAKRPTAQQLADALSGADDAHATSDTIALRDSFYQHIATMAAAPPESVRAAFAAGLMPQRRSQRRRAWFAVVGAVVTVAVVALAVVLLPPASDHAAAPPSGSSGSSGKSATATLSNPGPTPGSPANQTSNNATDVPAGVGSSPTTFLRTRVSDQPLRDAYWSSSTHSCNSDVVLDEQPTDGWEWAKPGDDTSTLPAGATSVALGWRDKYQAHTDYYIQAVVLPPAWTQGNDIYSAWVSSAKPVPQDTWSNVVFPNDFKPLHLDSHTVDASVNMGTAGDWTVQYYHVHSDGQAYLVACNGFTIPGQHP